MIASRRCSSAVLYLLAACTACQTPHHDLAAGLRVLRGDPLATGPGRFYALLPPSLSKLPRALTRDPLDASSAASALANLDQAISSARSALNDAPAATHDQVGWVIPLALLGKAEVHAALGQVTQVEEACWEAVRQSEEIFGQHLPSSWVGEQPAPFGALYVFYRREKVRRQAFALLKEVYRRAGEQDLERLMDAQLFNSDLYLRSPVAHQEEELARTYECADWVRLSDNTRSEARQNLWTTVIITMMVLTAAAVGFQSAELQSAQGMTSDPALQAELQRQQQELNQSLNDLAMSSAALIESVHSSAADERAGNEERFRHTAVTTLRELVSILSSSELVARLPAFRRLKEQADALDGYVARRGFDRSAAQALSRLRTTLDELTVELQRRRSSR